jgi:hypothetical protein
VWLWPGQAAETARTMPDWLWPLAFPLALLIALLVWGWFDRED